MTDILAHLRCLEPYLSSTTVRQLSHIVVAMLMMTGRVTMLGMSRWTDKGSSYRTIQRFFTTAIPWALVFWLFFRHWLFNSDDVYLLAGDESVVTKSGKKTYGLDRFFAGLYGKPVPGLSLLCVVPGECQRTPVVSDHGRTTSARHGTKSSAETEKEQTTSDQT